VEFLGVVIGPKGVEMQKDKIEGVLNWPTLKNVKEMQKFLESANYYRQFIKDFAKLAAPLYISDYTTESVLSTKYKDGKWRLVVFISKLLNATEQNYEIYDKEILAVIQCLEVWKHYLKEAKMEFEIWTDHKNL